MNDLGNIIGKDGVKLKVTLEPEQICMIIFGLALVLVFGTVIGGVIVNKITK